MIKVDTTQAIRDLKRGFSFMNKTDFNTAVARAMNRSVAKGRTAASQGIRKHYKIKAGDLKKTMSVNRANVSRLKAALELKGAPIAISKFGASKRKKGVSVRVSGQRKLIRGAFMARTKSGHLGVFARGSYTKRGFKFRKRRTKSGTEFRMVNGRPVPVNSPDTPITELKTLSTPVMFGQSKVNEPVQHITAQHFKGRLAHELNYLSNRHY